MRGTIGVTLTSKGSSTGAASVTGLPFTSANLTGNGSLTPFIGNLGQLLSFQVGQNATKGDTVVSTGGNADNTNFGNNSFFNCDFDYMTTQ